MNIEFLSSVAVIAPDPPASRKLYVETLGLPLEGHGGDYYHSEQVAGCKSLGIWPLSQAAEACFGTAQWPVGRPVPQVSIGPPRRPSAGATRPRRRTLEGAVSVRKASPSHCTTATQVGSVLLGVLSISAEVAQTFTDRSG